MSKFLRSFVFVTIAFSFVLTACGTSATPTATEAMPATQAPAAAAMPAATAAPTPLAPGSVQITAGGATFPYPLYSQWFFGFEQVDPSVQINYQPIGSGGGKSGIIANTFDFAGSDSALSDQNYTDGKDLQMYPMVASAVVVIYNIQFNMPKAAAGAATPTAVKLPNLVLDRQTLVDIYNAKVSKWNDPEIVNTNPGLKDYLPNATITVVHRSDGSGTTNIFTSALASFSKDWTAGAAQSVQWPVDKAGNGIGGKGNAGVAAAVINTPNSLGYVEINYAVSNSLPFADMINKAGKQVTSNAASLASDMSDFGTAGFNDKLVATIVDGGGAGSWPISGYTYLILHTTSMTDCVKAGKILEFMNWALTDKSAASQAGILGYSVLPDAIRQQVLTTLGKVTCNGQPVTPK